MQRARAGTGAASPSGAAARQRSEAQAQSPMPPPSPAHAVRAVQPNVARASRVARAARTLPLTADGAPSPAVDGSEVESPSAEAGVVSCREVRCEPSRLFRASRALQERLPLEQFDDPEHETRALVEAPAFGEEGMLAQCKYFVEQEWRWSVREAYSQCSVCMSLGGVVAGCRAASWHSTRRRNSSQCASRPTVTSRRYGDSACGSPASTRKASTAGCSCANRYTADPACAEASRAQTRPLRVPCAVA